MRSVKITLAMGLLWLCVAPMVWAVGGGGGAVAGGMHPAAQDTTGSAHPRADSLRGLPNDGPVETVRVGPDSTQRKTATLDAPVHTQARDSMHYDVRRRLVTLYGDGELRYKNQQFNAGYVQLDMGQRQLFAEGVKNDSGVMKENPKFREGNDLYDMEAIDYNFATGKARIRGVITQVSEGYLRGRVIKRLPNNEFNVAGGKFTTCDLPHPHFYIGLTKAKVIPNDKIVTSLAYLTIADVPTPLVLPFGFFPNTRKRASGILMPEYGEEARRGYFIRNGGIYIGLSDYVDFKLMGGYYSRGSWDASIQSSYALRYRFSGSISFSMSRILSGYEKTPTYVDARTYLLTWSHTQDRATHPNSNFSANVTLGSSSNNRYNAKSTQDYLNNQTMSSVNYSRSFPGTPISMSLSLNHSQNTRDSIWSLGIPTINLNVARITPFKRANRVGKEQWWERIGLNYSANLQNSLTIKEDKLFTREAIKRMRNGMSHQASVGTSFNLLKFINISPSAQYRENWYLQTIRYRWVDSLRRSQRDTVDGFARAWQFSTSVSASTKLYGMFAFRPNRLVKAIRHVITPSVGLSYHPDFSDPKWGMYREIREDSRPDKMRRYSIFETGIYGGPPMGKSGSISFSLGNNLEMKRPAGQDTTKKEKVIKLIDNLSLNASYNFLADSLNWSSLGVSARTNLLNFLDVNASASFSPYSTTESGAIVNRYYWRETRIPLRFERFSLSCSFSLDRAITGKNGKGIPIMPFAYMPGYYRFGDALTAQMLTMEYADFSAPWNLAVSYSYNYTKMTPKRVSTSQSVSISGGFSINQAWRFGFTSGFDMNTLEPTITTLNIGRDLHCWDMYVSIVPWGTLQSFSFRINVKSGVLRDLKFEKRKSYLDNIL